MSPVGALAGIYLLGKAKKGCGLSQGPAPGGRRGPRFFSAAGHPSRRDGQPRYPIFFSGAAAIAYIPRRSSRSSSFVNVGSVSPITLNLSRLPVIRYE